MWNYLKKPTSILVILAILTSSFPIPARAASNTLGYFETANGGGSNSSQANVIVSPFTTNANGGTVKTGRFYTKVSSGSALTTLVIYSNSSGSPGTLLATSDETTVTSTTLTTVNYTFSGANQITLLPNTTYFIGMHHSDPGTPTISETFNTNSTASNCVYWNFNDTYPGAETTFTTDDSFCFSEFNVDISYDSPEGVSYPIINSRLNDSGLAYDFDGVDEYLTKTGPTFGTDAKTGGKAICMWFNLDNLPASETNNTLWAWSQTGTAGVWNFHIRNGRSTVPWTGSRFEMQTAADAGASNGLSTFIYDSSSTISAGTQYFLCYQTTGTAWQLYLNGNLETLTVTTTGSGGNDGDWVGEVGFDGTAIMNIGTATTPPDGKIDNLMYCSDDLTSTEVNLLYNGGKPIHPYAVGVTDCSNFWKLGEDDNGSVSTTYDALNTSNNLTPTNMENGDIVTRSYY